MLPQDLVPIPPDPTNPESMAVFEDHRRMAVDYVKMATEMSLLEASIKELRRELNEEEEHNTVLDARGQESLFKEYQKLLDDKDSFESLYKCLEAQLEAAKKGQLQA
jgi:mitogen-activated protein kinase kinase kinase 7